MLHVHGGRGSWQRQTHRELSEIPQLSSSLPSQVQKVDVAVSESKKKKVPVQTFDKELFTAVIPSENQVYVNTMCVVFVWCNVRKMAILSYNILLRNNSTIQYR